MKIKFGYNMQKVDVIKACPDGRQYNKKGKHWEVPNTIDNLKYLLFYASLFDLDKDQLKSRIKEMVKPLSTKNEFNIDWRCKPYKHQEHGLKLALNNKSIALWWEAGCGKTLPTIKAIEYRLKNKMIDKTLIVCPKTVLYAWGIQLKEFSNLSHIVIGGTKLKRTKQLESRVDVFLINYDLLRMMENDLILKSFDMLVLDESQFVKNNNSKRSKSAYKISEKAKYKMLLSGTPIGRDSSDLFSQYKILDETIFGKSYYSFRNKYFINTNQYYPDWKLKPDSVEKIKKKMELRGQRLTKNEVLDLPGKIYQTLTFEMTPEQKRIYKDMKEKMVAIINNEVVNVSVLISKLMKLNQISAGFYINDGEVLNINDDKVKEVRKIVDSNPTEKVTVWVTFKYDIVKLKKEFPDALVISGDVKQEDRGIAIDQFQNNPDRKMIILQIQAGSTGITLTASSLVIFYSRNYNLLDRIQAEARNDRISQVNKVLYIDLIVEDSIESIILSNLEKKRKVASDLLGDAENISYMKNIINDIKELEF